MASLSNIVSITITKSTRTPTAQGFGTPLLFGYFPTSIFSDLVRVYSSDTGLEDMLADGFTVNHPLYRMAQALLSQDTTVDRFKIGRLTAAHTHTIKLTITSAVEGKHVKAKFARPTDGTVETIDYTIGAAASTTTVATAVELLTEALTGVSSTSSGAVITCVAATPGDVLYFYDLENCTIEDSTADANYDDDLAALNLVDDDWYVPVIDVAGAANVDKVAAWAEAQTKIYVQTVIDTAEANGTGTLCTALQTLAYDRTGLIYHPRLHEYAAASWAGAVLPFPAGGVTWMFKKLGGVSSVSLTTAQETTLLSHGCNTYETIAGLPITQNGIAVSGEFLDITHGTDQLKARMRESVFGYLASKGKVAYEDEEVGTIVNIVKQVMGAAVKDKFLAAGTLSASGPKVADVLTADRAARTLPDIQFAARYASAVHKVRLAGTLSI